MRRHGSSSKLSMVVALASVLGACSALPLDETRSIPHTTDPNPATAYVEPEYGTYEPYFTDELRRRYLSLMQDAWERGDLRDYYHFREKGYAALIGGLPGPDRVASREVADRARYEALQVRQRLVTALEATARVTMPVEAAAAEASFDCWLAELEAGTRADLSTRCREDLVASLSRLETR